MVSKFDADPDFMKCLSELGLSIPNKEILLRMQVTEVAKKIVDGVLDPIEGVNVVHRDVVSPLKHPADLQDWCFVWEGNDPKTFEPLEQDEETKACRRVAEEWMERHPSKAPQRAK